MSRVVTCNLYRHYDADNELLYIGVSFSALVRLRQHQVTAHWTSRIARVEIETYPTRAEALEAEREAIRTEAPRHNVIHSTINHAARRADRQVMARRSKVTLAEALAEFRQDAADAVIAHVVRTHFGDLLTERLVQITPERLVGRERMLAQTHGAEKAQAAMAVLLEVLDFADGFFSDTQPCGGCGVRQK